jgi:hypothetical protein
MNSPGELELSNWRFTILKDFEEPVPALSLVSDPDGLLLDESLLSQLAVKHIELIDYRDPVAFRYLYEKAYRPALAAGNIRLVVRTEAELEDVFPYDLLDSGRVLYYQVSTLFPGLSAPVIRELELTCLDELYTTGGEYQLAASNAETCDLILRKVFKVALETIVTPAELLKFLLAKHYRNRNYPKPVEAYLVERLSKQKIFRNLPLMEFIRSSNTFYQYLQTEWRGFLDKYKDIPHVREEKPTDSSYGEPVDPLEDPEVRRLMDNLFIEGKLQPVAGYHKDQVPNWAHAGIIIDPLADTKTRMDKLYRTIQERLRDTHDYKDWMRIAALWGEFSEVRLEIEFAKEDSRADQIAGLEQHLDQTFLTWISEKFSGLKNLPYLPAPVMVHHIPHYLASKHHGKTALIVMDGMSWVQWVKIRNYLRSQFQCEILESSVFAWIPTITSISRQAIFTGEAPVFFANSIDSTAKEETAWKLFWENHGIIPNYTAYQKGLGKGNYLGSEPIWKNNTKVIGLVIDMLDRLGHASLQGQAGFRMEIELWLKNGYLESIMNDLYSQGFEVYITSDHGNKESRGMGIISQGILAEIRGERVRIYSDRGLRDKTAREYGLLSWPGDGLPENMFTLLAPGNSAFIKKDEVIVSHGGISLEETIVPFAQIQWR